MQAAVYRTGIWACEESEDDPNRCRACVQWGRPCSWTYISKLLGEDWANQVLGHIADAGNRETVSNRGPITDKAKEMYKALIAQPLNEKACTSRPSSDPGFIEVSDEVAEAMEEMEHEPHD